MSTHISSIQVRRAVNTLRDGGVIAYPTEGVFGLGCDPQQYEAVLRILILKNRPVSAGMILLADHREQLDDWIHPTADEEKSLSATDDFITWIVTAGSLCPEWISGGRSTCAVRITRHPVAAALCAAADSPLVSTSANLHGQLPATSQLGVRRIFGRTIDLIVPGETGGADGPSEIRVAASGAILRHG